jgi:hypothetical protein
MNNQKFKWWFMSLVIGIAAVLVYRLVTVESRIPEHLQGVPNPELTVSMAENGQLGEIEHHAELSQFTPSEMDSILEILQPPMFHEDAYVEAKILFELKSSCKYRQQTKLPCDEVTMRFNKLEKFIQVYQDLQHIPSSTELGEALKQGWGYDAEHPEIYRQNTQNLLKKIIQSNNPHVLSLYSMNFIYGGIDKGEILPFTEWLGSQDQDYNGLVLMYALLKMANQFVSSDNNGSNGFISFTFCTVDTSLCDSGFEEGYNLLVMPGMQKDVDLMITHLKTFASEP